MSDLQALTKNRGMVKATLTNIKKFADKFSWDSDSASIEQIETRIEKLTEAWKEFHEIEHQISLLDPETSEADEFEDRYFELHTTLKRLINIRSHNISFVGTSHNESRIADNSMERSANQISDLRLPRVMIEQFSGDYSKWQSFQDQFETSIHKKDNISNIHKFQYLKSLLKNEAAALIRHMSLTDANYQLAWEKLKKRYNKKKYSVRELIELFLNQPIINSEGHKQLRSLCDTSDEVLRGIEALGTKWQSRAPWLIQIITKKLDYHSQQAWAKHSNDNESPTITCLLDFLTERCDALETCSSIKRPVSNRQNSNAKVYAGTTVFKKCSMCNTTTHSLFKCFKFKKLNTKERKHIIQINNLCSNCLFPGHDFSNCETDIRCFKCGSKHHTLLHEENVTFREKYDPVRKASNHREVLSNYFSTCAESALNEELNLTAINAKVTPINNLTTINESALTTTSSSSKPPSTSSCSLTSTAATQQNSLTYHCSATQIQPQHSASAPRINTLLSTVVFYILDEFGTKHMARGLLDSGSQTTLISESYVKQTGLQRRRSNVVVKGLASQKSGVTKGEVNLHMISIMNPKQSVSTRALILNKLTSNLPMNKFDDSDFSIIKNLNLADPSYNIPGVIDVILGNDIFYEIILTDKIQIKDHLYAQSTIFGWTIGGQILSSKGSVNVCHTTLSRNENKHLLQLLKYFWDIEDLSSNTNHKSANHECEEHYINNTTGANDGRYTVRLPFHSSPEVDLGVTYHKAEKRFYGLEKKFNIHPEIKHDYIEFMKEYELLGHMMKIKCSDETSNRYHKGYHLPHHCVVNAKSSTTKLRVVFDGSCKSTTGRSLNDLLRVGPTIQDDLAMILLRFRTHKIAVTADIQKMYRQIKLHHADQDFQRILWRDSPDQEIQQFRLTTVTYGTSSAPFLACRTLHQLANDYAQQYPIAAACLKSDFYVDDVLTGADNLAEATRTYEDIISLLKNGGFNLHKWMTNDPILARWFQESDHESKFLEFDDIAVVKTLGLLWSPQDDSFTFWVSLEHTTKVSKRTLLSEASRIFDLPGWLSPSIILIKVLFQQLWIQKLNWDDELTGDIRERWLKIRSSLQDLQTIHIPRFINTYRNQPLNIQMHGFSDASEMAYGAAVYIRVQDHAGNTFVNLLAAKTKVCPIKQISVPRLELCAAVLLSRLLEYIQQSVKLKICSVYAWTDSQIVLAWLSDIPRRWKCFIGNRTSYILEKFPRDNWRYVPSKQNPADAASRGLTPQSLILSKLWWNGPEWLMKEEKYWPKIMSAHSTGNAFEEKDLEVRKQHLDAFHVTLTGPHPCKILSAKYSSLNKIYRVLSYVYRFILKVSGKYKEEVVQIDKGILPPTVDEIILAENCYIKWVQDEAFAVDIKNIKMNNEVKKDSILSSLSPFIDDIGILRVGGRLSNSIANFNAQHPIILPQTHVYTQLLVDKYHRDHIHPGLALLTSILQQRFWIIGCRKVSRWYVQKCLLCFIRKRVNNYKLMADLPKERVTTGRPFLNTGVDYAGPIYLKDRKGPGRARITKAYIALFICLSVKAIHIELVTDMTSEAFIAALKRFISRRGMPCQIHCDNESNFVGARNELHVLYEQCRSDSHTKLIYELLSPQKIRFKFNPPNAPHFGGLWESNIKSVKAHLTKVSGPTPFSYEEASTLLTQIEAVLNSRPLCGISDDISSYDALTPAHFLIGEPFTAVPEPDLNHIKSSRLSKWQNIQNRVQAFWKSWSRDCLSTLNQRAKWQHRIPNLRVDQLVIVREDHISQISGLLDEFKRYIQIKMVKFASIS